MTDSEISESVARKLGWFERVPKTTPIIRNKREIGKSISEEELCFPDYCHSIAAAWEIVEKQGYFRMFLDRELMGHGQRSGYVCVFSVPGSAKFIEEWAPTAPMAICLAFLKLP